MSSEKVVAKDNKGIILGTGSVNVCESWKDVESLGHEEIIALVNRQRKTDCRNNLARKVSEVAQLKKLAKSNPAAKADIDAILRKYGK